MGEDVTTKALGLFFSTIEDNRTLSTELVLGLFTEFCEYLVYL